MNPLHRRLPQLTTIAAAVGLVTAAQAFQIETGAPDLKIRLDTTVKLSAAARVAQRSDGLSTTAFGPTGIVGPNNINQDDGNNNFGRGLVSTRLDVLSEFDLSYRQVGLRLSGAGWYDSVYNRDTANGSFSANHSPANEFADETRQIMGRKAELLDAFVFGKFELGDRPATVRLGRHTLLWGESLFFGANGMAGGMAPLDLPKLLSVPNAQFKEIARPTGKLSGQVQLSADVSVGAYVAYEWEKTRLMPAGAYLSTSDAMGPGAERIHAGATGVFQRQDDLEARNSGQYGAQLRWRSEELDTDFGFYAIRYHATGPSNIWTALTGFPPSANGPGNLAASSYRWAYHEGIRAYGVSFAKSVGEWGLAGELSYRTNAPLASSGQSVLSSINVNTDFNNSDNPGYAVGETAHAQFSWIASLGPSFLSQEASFVGEVAWNTRVKVTRNEAMLNPNADRSATALRMVFAPSYRQALPGLDLTPSLGIGWGWGKSSAVGPAFAVDKGGDLTLGLGAVYLGSWNANLAYTHYLGPEGPTLDNNSNAQFTQALKDRNFVSLSLRTTF